MIQFGSDKIKENYVGSDKIKEVYHGADLVWSGSKPSYLIKTDGTKVDFEQENTPINNLCVIPGPTPPPLSINGHSIHRTEIKDVYIGDSYGQVTEIGNAFLSGCKSLISINLTSLTNLTKVGNSFLAGCTSLISIDLTTLTKLEIVGDSFMHGCSSIILIDLSKALHFTIAGAYFLFNCGSLQILRIGATSVPSAVSAGFLLGTLALTTVLVPMQSVQAYKTTAPWSNHASKIQGY